MVETMHSAASGSSASSLRPSALPVKKGRVDRTRRVIQRHDQIERRLTTAQPFMPRPVLMQHHARQRPARPLAAVRAAPLRLLQQTLRMQERLRPGITPGEPMVAHQMLVEMLRREAPIACLVQRLDLGLPVARNPLARHFAKPTVQKTRFALILVALAPPPERPLPDAQKLRCFQLAELRALVTAQHVDKLDHSHTLMGFRPAHSRPSKKSESTGQIVRYLNRTYRVLPTFPNIYACRTHREQIRSVHALFKHLHQ